MLESVNLTPVAEVTFGWPPKTYHFRGAVCYIYDYEFGYLAFCWVSMN